MAKKSKVLERVRQAFSDHKVDYDEEQEQIRIEHGEIGKGLTLDLPRLESKYENKGEDGFTETLAYIQETFDAMKKQKSLSGREQMIYPVVRSTSFPTETEDGRTLIYDEHTAETRIYYALDQGKTYALIDQQMLEDEGISEQKMKEAARFNVRSLATPLKADDVAGNRFYFVNTNDGYDASRILHEAWVKEMAASVEGELALAVPHQDVLILADIQNDEGYDVLAQMTFKFFGDGRMPITALPFIYDDGKLDPIFILARKKPKKDQ
ncbi:DUF1444 family protein [Natribacillus halophilus]|uniref:Uncharacterized protein YtpQ, UPF0354 family n=1 Tax=Natribacillus halophilus TaxID=549003 RepID=A0A1G8NFR1_9BACI|nr:DUF1444 family protein [Natribacillus halophilus]SDI79109.1 Uncharacterized protein YtpQ, UPF0354 family [Natribacillus halophilus]